MEAFMQTCKRTIVFSGLLVLLSLGSGCVKTSVMHQGNQVSDVQVVALQQGGPFADRWKTFDLILDYKYKLVGDVFEISGQAVLSEHYQMMYANISYLWVYLFFLDDESRVLETVLLAASLNGQVDEQYTFTKGLKVPPGTVSVSFGYDGYATDWEGSSIFYRLPLRK
jgi:hypothetical protein